MTLHGLPLRLEGLPPLVSDHTRVLVLGSFPSVASLKAQQYYAHPRNQFWKIISALLDEDLYTVDYPLMRQQLLSTSIGIWDVYASCERAGSLDSAIQNATLNDFAALLKQHPHIKAVAHNGGESAKHRKLFEALGLQVHVLPSTSPANASWSFDRKLQAWREVLAPYF